MNIYIYKYWERNKQMTTESEDVRMLKLALKTDNEKILQSLMKKGLNATDVLTQSEDLPEMLRHEPPLYSACVYYAARKCFKLLASSNQNFYKEDLEGVQISKFAIIGGDCDIIDILNLFGFEFEKDLPFAAKNRCDVVFKFICQIQVKEFDIDIMDSTNNASVHYAAQNGDLDLLKFLKEQKSNFNIINGDGYTPLMFAVMRGHVECVRYLINECSDIHVDVNIADKSGATALLWAVKNDHPQCIRELLLSPEIDVNKKDNLGFTPLLYAASVGNAVTFSEIYSSEGANVSERTEAGLNALMLAAINGNKELVKLILGLEDGRIDINDVDPQRKTALHFSAANDTVGATHLILETMKADPTLSDNDGNTPLHIASRNGNLEIVTAYCKPGQNVKAVDINAANSRGLTPLHCAAIGGCETVCRFLLEQEGIQPDARAEFDKTPLHYAAGAFSSAIKNDSDKRGRYEGVVRALASHHKVDVNARDCWGKTPLHYAVQMQNLETTCILVSNPRTDVNIANLFNNAPVHYASSSGSFETSLLLLDVDAIDCNLKGRSGNTPLHLSVINDHERVVDLLLEKIERPEDVRIPDAYKNNVVDYHSKFANNELVRAALFRRMNQPYEKFEGVPPPPPPPPPPERYFFSQLPSAISVVPPP